MSKFHYDLSGAEPIIRDVPVFDATTLVYGEFIMLDSTAASNCRFITGYTASSAEMVDGLGILNETLTTTSKADPGDAVTTAQTTSAAAISSIAATLAQGHRYGKAIINPLAVYLTEYSQAAADDVALTSAWNSTTLTLTSLEDNIDGGWILGADASAAAFEGQLRYIDTSASGSCTVTVAPTVAGTTSDTIVKILPLCSKTTALNAASTDLLSAAGAGSGISLEIIENYISTPSRPLMPLKVGTFTRSSTTDAAADLGTDVKAYADVLIIDHIFNNNAA